MCTVRARPLPWRWKVYDYLEHSCASTRLHGVNPKYHNTGLSPFWKPVSHLSHLYTIQYQKLYKQPTAKLLAFSRRTNTSSELLYTSHPDVKHANPNARPALVGLKSTGVVSRKLAASALGFAEDVLAHRPCRVVNHVPRGSEGQLLRNVRYKQHNMTTVFTYCIWLPEVLTDISACT